MNDTMPAVPKRSKFEMNAQLWQYVLDLFAKEGQGALTHREACHLAFYVAELDLGTDKHPNLPYEEISHMLS